MTGWAARIDRRTLRDQSLFWMFVLVFLGLVSWYFSPVSPRIHIVLYPMLWISAVILFLCFPGGPHTKNSACLVMGLTLTVHLIGAPFPGVRDVLRTAVLADLLTVALMLRCLEDLNLDSRWALLYGLNPMVLIVNAGNPFGAWAGFCLFVGWYAYGRVRWNRILLKPQYNRAFSLLALSMICVSGALFFRAPDLVMGPVCWLLPFALIYRKMSWLLVTLSMGMSGAGVYHAFTGWAFMAWVPFVICVFIELRIGYLRSSNGVYSGPVRDVSVVIPVINEAETITACVSRVLEDRAVREVIVVDGGSSDNTVSRAMAAGAMVVVHRVPPEKGGGRGGQISRGIDEVKGDVVAIVHADTRVEVGSFTFLLKFLKTNPGVVGGSMGCVFDGSSLKLKVIDVLNTLRASLFFIAFGDQVQYFRRKPLAERNLFPAIPLMEDVELSLRLLSLGTTVHHFSQFRVSPRRWNAHGIANVLIVLWFFACYMAQRIWKTPDTLSLYRRYYRK